MISINSLRVSRNFFDYDKGIFEARLKKARIQWKGNSIKQGNKLFINPETYIRYDVERFGNRYLSSNFAKNMLCRWTMLGPYNFSLQTTTSSMLLCVHPGILLVGGDHLNVWLVRRMVFASIFWSVLWICSATIHSECTPELYNLQTMVDITQCFMSLWCDLL